MLKKVFVVPYFGFTPEYFQFWLNSCGNNHGFIWYFLTDCEVSEFQFPKNVIVKTINLESIKLIFEKYLELRISLEKPYKLCDFRPIYWILLDYFEVEYDYWGYCDIDLLFGDLEKFIPDEVIKRYDKIFSFGHLTLLRNAIFVKTAFKLEGSENFYARVFTSEKNFGFDEYHGINKICKKNGISVYKNENKIADLDPNFEKLRLIKPTLNKIGQRFIYDNGHIYQVVFSSDKVRKRIIREFAYIHFQKRDMKVKVKSDESQFEIDYNELKVIDELKTFEFNLEIDYWYRLFVTVLRYYRQKVYKGKLKV